MISVILEYSPECEKRAVANGFVKKTVLVKNETIRSDDKAAREAREAKVLRELSPYQYFLGDFWGMGNDDG